MISIIIPSKNEPNVLKMIESAELLGDQIIICNDRYAKGKGWAIRQALKEAKGDIICFIDGDCDIAARMIKRLAPFLEDYDVVVGKRLLVGPLSRRAITLCSRIFIGLLFGLWIQTQVGIKMFKRSALPDWDNDSFAFDIEILYKAKKKGAKIIEVPVEVSINKSMPIRSIFRFILGALQIRCSQK